MKKKVIFISVVIAILLIGTAVAGVISKSRVKAAEECEHEWSNGTCDKCHAECAHSSYEGGSCTTCGTACNHYWDYGICTICGESHNCTDWAGPYPGENNTHVWSCNDGCGAVKFEGSCSFTDGVCECGNTCDHIWTEATCTSPEYCGKCGATEGEAIGHDFGEATCDTPATCSRCSETEGDALGHDMSESTCTDGGTCKREGCNAMDDALGHLRKEPTCTEPGGCNREGCDLYIPPTGHQTVNLNEIPCNNPQIGCGNKGCTEEYKGTKHSTETAWASNDNQHWEVCADCEEKVTGTEENHYISAGEATDNNNGTHTGNCKVCEELYTEEHRDEDDNKKCDICEATIESGTTPDCSHEGGTHDNGGKCTRPECGEIYQIHEKSTIVVNYINKTATGHTPVYGCTYEDSTGKKCTGTYEGTEEAHEDENSNNICDLCDYTMSSGTTPECKHTNQAWDRTETKHWKVCVECGEKITGTEENHSYTNGKCKCGRLENTNTCEHTNIVWDRTETEHWKVCVECGKEIQGTRKTHSYTNGKCECGRLENGKTCEHKNTEWKSNKDEHWKVCKDCGEEIEGTREKHKLTNEKCKDCGADKDSTTTGKDIPNTGSETVVIGIIAITAVMGMSIIGIKKYKGI